MTITEAVMNEVLQSIRPETAAKMFLDFRVRNAELYEVVMAFLRNPQYWSDDDINRFDTEEERLIKSGYLLEVNQWKWK